MAPNLKEISSLLDIASLDLSSFIDKSAFAPLTSSSFEVSVPTNAKQQQVVEIESSVEEIIVSDHVLTGDDSSANYWDWQPEPTAAETKQALIQQILVEEDARLAVSASNIVSLEVAAASKSDQVQSVSVEGEYNEVEGYWDMATENYVADEVITAQHMSDESHPNNAYWDWDASPKSSEDLKSETIATILMEDDIRRSLTVERIEENIMKPPTRTTNDANTVQGTPHHEPNYWNMSLIDESIQAENATIQDVMAIGQEDWGADYREEAEEDVASNWMW
eukprot:CAMPEP_0198290820 /NCGR_PEP_ID=MMETSP1449-20131203/8546_1 /TAXON_ID=420275 /ORGANISM="Attheya septentrionalis, Strain CCMP2084" /LENGTH=278 /DNA_ID=CAMNT_0043989369 /DNA_START=292 /DNA_END=1128 /DNA_ORIENTATION=-